MAYTAEKPPLAESSDDLRQRIPGWGADLDPSDRPAVPRLQFDADLGVEIALGVEQLARLLRRRGNEPVEFTLDQRFATGQTVDPPEVEVGLEQFSQGLRRPHFEPDHRRRLGLTAELFGQRRARAEQQPRRQRPQRLEPSPPRPRSAPRRRTDDDP